MYRLRFNFFDPVFMLLIFAVEFVFGPSFCIFDPSLLSTAETLSIKQLKLSMSLQVPVILDKASQPRTPYLLHVHVPLSSETIRTSLQQARGLGP